MKSDSEFAESPDKKQAKKEAEEAKERARQAFEYRSKKSSDSIYYWMVLGGFVVMCLACVYYIFREWRESPNLVLAVNKVDIESHNARAGMPFQRGPNSLFQNWDLDYAKHLFQSYLSDDFKDIYFCASKEDKTAIIPDSFDFRESYKQCARDVQNQGNCSAAWALTMASMISDRICMITNKSIQVSAQYVISCDLDINEGCKRGYAQRAFDFFSRNKIINESCMPFKQGEFVNCSDKCSETLPDHGRIARICGVDSQEQIKREIILNGPLVASFEVHSDFLTYKSGVYFADFAPYVYAGSHLVKLIGWGTENGMKYWLIENTWGKDWGMGGFAKIGILGNDDLHISQLAIGAVIEGKREEKKPKATPKAETTENK
jgi:cathepsin B